SGELEIKLRGPLHADAGGLQVPDVFLFGNHALPRFVLLDRGSPGQPIDWEISGLLAARPDSALGAAAMQSASGDLFQVASQRFFAVAKTRPAGAAVPRVLLADMHAVLHASRRVEVTADIII